MNYVPIPNVRFNLKSHTNKSKEVLIISVFRYKVNEKSLRLVYSTGQKVLPKFWKQRNNRCSFRLNDTLSGGTTITNEFIQSLNRINEILDSLEVEIKRVFAANPEIQIDQFKLELDYFIGRKQKPLEDESRIDFFTFLQNEVDNNKKRVNGLVGGQTWQKYQSLLTRLKSYCDRYQLSKVDFKDFDEKFKDQYIEWLESKELSQNSISKDIETIKSLLRRSRKYHKNTFYDDPDFKVKRKKVPKHFPTLSELKLLFHHEFTNERIQKAVDLYLISAFGGGLRWSDVRNLNRDNEIEIDGTQVLQVHTYKGRNTKSDNEVAIPITPQLRSLIDKYEWNLPKMSQTEVNRMIKKAFEQVELTRTVLNHSGIKDKKAESKRLCDLVSFHSARYAFINYMINELDQSIENVAKITGQSIKTLLGYERGDKKKNAIKVGMEINKKLVGLYAIKGKAQ